MGEHIVTIAPQHGTDIVQVGTEQRGERIVCDGLLTVQPRVTVCLNTADCFPVLVYVLNPRMLALLHAGRKGTENGIVPLFLDAIKRMHGDLALRTLRIAIGPGIRECCYQQNLSAFAAQHQDDWQPYVRQDAEGVSYCDVFGFIMQQCRAVGIGQHQITAAPYCTCCATDEQTGQYLFFSHQRAVRSKGKEQEGRFTVLAMLS